MPVGNASDGVGLFAGQMMFLQKTLMSKLMEIEQITIKLIDRWNKSDERAERRYEKSVDEMSLLEAGQTSISNIPSSAAQYGSDISEAVMHPIKTAKSIYELGKGAVQLVIPGEQGNEELARGVGKFFAERYGTVESIKKTIANDPILL